MRRVLKWPVALLLAASFGAAAQDMRPNKDPVPSPSDLRAERGQDRPGGEAPEARTPSPSDLAVERPRVDGDRPTDTLLDPRSAGAGGTAPVPSPSDLSSGSQIR
jgi:hypothetical protein